MDLKQRTAYGGGEWNRIKRTKGFWEEREAGTIWRRSGYNTEYARLRDVVLRMPGQEISKISNPDSVQFLDCPELDVLREEILRLADVYRAAGVHVHFVNTPAAKPNLLFMRELFLATKGVTFIARPATEVRAGEEVYVAAALARLGVPLRVVTDGIFEAADVVFLKPDEVVFRQGNRSSPEVIEEILRSSTDLLRLVGRYSWSGDATQHLLGVMCILDHDLAVMRRLAPPQLVQTVRRDIGEVVFLEETNEVTHRQAMNVTVLGPRKIVMPDDCPETRRVYEEHDVEVIVTKATEIRKGAGGISCATGVLTRDIIERRG